MKPWRYADMPESLRKRVDAAEGNGKGEALPVTPTPTVQRRGPNKTELRFLRECLDGEHALYEGLRFLLPGDDKRHFTPDWIVERDGLVTCYEVKRRFKGGARLLSYRDARGRFDSARAAWPSFRWVWAELQPDGRWEMS